MRKALDADEDAGHRNRRAKGAAAPEEGFGVRGGREVFGTGDPSPTRGREVGRICRGVVRGWEVVLHTSSVKNQRFLTASPQGEAFGCGVDGRFSGRETRPLRESRGCGGRERQSLSQNRFRRAGFDSSLYTREPGALPRRCNSTVAVCMEAGKRAINDRPYIHDGKCYGFAGRQMEFVMFVCREAERLPYDLHGRSCGFAVAWCGDGRLCCTPHQSKIKDF